MITKVGGCQQAADAVHGGGAVQLQQAPDAVDADVHQGAMPLEVRLHQAHQHRQTLQGTLRGHRNAAGSA